MNQQCRIPKCVQPPRIGWNHSRPFNTTNSKSTEGEETEERKREKEEENEDQQKLKCFIYTTVLHLSIPKKVFHQCDWHLSGVSGRKAAWEPLDKSKSLIGLNQFCLEKNSFIVTFLPPSVIWQNRTSTPITRPKRNISQQRAHLTQLKPIYMEDQISHLWRIAFQVWVVRDEIYRLGQVG